MSIRIVVADDHQMMREGLCTLIEKQDDMEVVGQADNGRHAVQLARELVPDVVIMDVVMPDLNGMEAVRQILAEVPDTKVVALSMYSDKRFVEGMLGAGALGYLVKDCAVGDLFDAIHVVMADQFYLSARIAALVTGEYVRQLSIVNTTAYTELTPREREVLQLVAEGKSPKEAASRLHLSVKTVNTHRERIMNKLNLHSAAELTKYAVRQGLTSLEP